MDAVLVLYLTNRLNFVLLLMHRILYPTQRLGAPPLTEARLRHAGLPSPALFHGIRAKSPTSGAVL